MYQALGKGWMMHDEEKPAQSNTHGVYHLVGEALLQTICCCFLTSDM